MTHVRNGFKATIKLWDLFVKIKLEECKSGANEKVVNNKKLRTVFVVLFVFKM